MVGGRLVQVAGPRGNSKRVIIRRQPRVSKLNKVQRKQVKRIVAGVQELKYTDFTYAYTNQSYNTGLTTPTQLSLGITQGDGVNQRSGDKIMLKMLDIRLSFYHVFSAVTDIPNSLRIILFKWNLPTMVSTPTVGSILAYAPSVGGNLNYSVNSPYSWTNRKENNFTILCDRQFSMQTNRAQQFHIRKMKNLGHIQYDVGLQTGKGLIYLLVLNDDGLAIAPTVAAGFVSRLTYTDS